MSIPTTSSANGNALPVSDAIDASCSPKQTVSKALRTIGIVPLVAIGLIACSPNVVTHGHNIEAEQVSQIQPGRSSQEEVLRLLGSPSATSVFDNERWYYVTKQTEETSFYQSEVLRQDVVTIEFDENRIVQGISSHGKEQSVALEPDPNETKTLGNELTFVQQLLGNVGRFNTGAAAPTAPGSAARR